MRQALLTAFAVAMLMSAGSIAGRTAAAPPALTAAQTPLLREAAIVCGGNGCNPVHTKADKKRKFQTLGHG